MFFDATVAAAYTRIFFENINGKISVRYAPAIKAKLYEEVANEWWTVAGLPIQPAREARGSILCVGVYVILFQNYYYYFFRSLE